MRHSAQGGKTSLTNVVSLCRPHHRSIHDGGYRIRPRDEASSTWEFLRADGWVVSTAPAHAPTTDAAVIPRNNELGLDIGPTTGMPAWCGQRLDLGMAIDGLYSRDHPLDTSS